MYKQLILPKRMIITMLCICLTFMGAVPTFAASITLEGGAVAPITIYAGKTYDLKVEGVKVKFYSDNKSVATIGLITGELKAVAPGTVKITAKSTKTGKTVATKNFTVLQRAESITADVSELYLNVGETATINATKTPATSTDVVSFASSDKTIAKVGATSGKVTAAKNGKCTITIYSKATETTADSSKNNKVTTVEVFVGPCIEQVIQKSTTELDITFKTFTEIKTSADLVIINDTTKATCAVKSVITDKENNKLVHVKTFAEIKDGQTYTVSYDQTSAQFIATAGQVADLQIVPTEIPYGSEETIYIQLLDANGIILGSYTKSNVPPNISIDMFEVSNGSYTTGDKMYLENKQSTGVVKAVYHTFKYENGQEVGEIEREQTITAIGSPEIKDNSDLVANFLLKNSSPQIDLTRDYGEVNEEIILYGELCTNDTIKFTVESINENDSYPIPEIIQDEQENYLLNLDLSGEMVTAGTYEYKIQCSYESEGVSKEIEHNVVINVIGEKPAPEDDPTPTKTPTEDSTEDSTEDPEEPQPMYVIGFESLGAAANQIVDFGTNKANIVLPTAITARTTSAAIKIQINTDGWSSWPAYNEKQSGTYIFTPNATLPEGYKFPSDVTWPQITVYVKQKPSSSSSGSSGSSSSSDSGGSKNSNSVSTTDQSNKSTSIINKLTEEIINKAIKENKPIEVKINKQEKISIEQKSIEKLIETKQQIKISRENITVEISANTLKQMISEDNSLEIEIKAMDEAKIKSIKQQVTQENKMTVIGDSTNTAVINLGNTNSAAIEKKFGEPIKIAISLKGIKEDFDASKVTLVRYDKQPDGTIKVVKLGGIYNEQEQMISGLVDREGEYGVVQAEELTKISLAIGNNVSVVNNQYINNEIASEMINGTTYVPLRFIAENLGANIKWEGKTKHITINIDDKQLDMTVEKEGSTNDAPLIKNNRTLVPLRYVSEQLGANVLWIPNTKDIEIVK